MTIFDIFGIFAAILILVTFVYGVDEDFRRAVRNKFKPKPKKIPTSPVVVKLINQIQNNPEDWSRSYGEVSNRKLDIKIECTPYSKSDTLRVKMNFSHLELSESDSVTLREALEIDLNRRKLEETAKKQAELEAILDPATKVNDEIKRLEKQVEASKADYRCLSTRVSDREYRVTAVLNQAKTNKKMTKKQLLELVEKELYK